MKMLLPALAALAWIYAPAAADAADVATGPSAQVAAAYRFTVGDVRVTALSDGTVPIDLHQLLRGIEPAQIDRLLTESFERNPVEASINAYLLELGDRRVLVDVGAGELFGPGNGGRLPEALAAIGVRPEQITDILITHVHSDHSGGLAVGGRMMFANAAIHAAQADVDFFLDSANAARTGYDKRYFDEARRTIGLYVAAGRVRPFIDATEILPGVMATLHPGHTPGTAFFTLKSRGQRIVFIGDIIHAGAVQFPNPRVTITFDQDQSRARQVREAAFAQFAKDGTLLAAPHLSFPGVGHVRRDSTGFRWLPIPFADREPRTVAPDLSARPTAPR